MIAKGVCPSALVLKSSGVRQGRVDLPVTKRSFPSISIRNASLLVGPSGFGFAALAAGAGAGVVCAAASLLSTNPAAAAPVTRMKSRREEDMASLSFRVVGID